MKLCSRLPSPLSLRIVMFPLSCGFSAYDVEEAIPARAAQRRRRVAEPGEGTAPAVLLARRRVGPVYEKRAALHVLPRQHAPAPAVAAVVAIVPHHEELPGGHSG